MTALDLLRSGDLDAALAALQADVRREPSEAKHRIFLFQLLSVLGDWNKALTQLRLCGQLDAAALPMAQTYREAIACELVRERVFRGETAPLVFGEPQQWIALLMQGLGALARGDAKGAEQLRAEAFDAAPMTSGELNGQPFEWIADADMRLGPLLEVVLNGKYYWVPFNQIRAIAIEEPADLRDRVWTPAQLTSASGGELPALIPTRYPFAGELDDPQLKLAKATRWDEQAEGLFTGAGARILATDAEEVALMDVRAIGLEVEAPEGAAAEPDAAEMEAEVALRAGPGSGDG